MVIETNPNPYIYVCVSPCPGRAQWLIQGEATHGLDRYHSSILPAEQIQEGEDAMEDFTSRPLLYYISWKEIVLRLGLAPETAMEWILSHTHLQRDFKHWNYSAFTDGGLRSAKDQTIMAIVEAKNAATVTSDIPPRNST